MASNDPGCGLRYGLRLRSDLKPLYNLDIIRGLEPNSVASSRRFGIGFAFSEKKKLVKQTSRILASLALAILFAVELSSCSKESPIAATTTTGPPAPVSEVDVMINDYEKVANEYVRVAKRLKGGDMSVTVRYLELDKHTREESAKLQQISVKMTPQQAQRLANISARTVPYL